MSGNFTPYSVLNDFLNKGGWSRILSFPLLLPIVVWVFLPSFLLLCSLSLLSANALIFQLPVQMTSGIACFYFDPYPKKWKRVWSGRHHFCLLMDAPQQFFKIVVPKVVKWYHSVPSFFSTTNYKSESNLACWKILHHEK